MTHPTGSQHQIQHEDQQAWITEVGAGLRAYAVGARHVLDGFGAEEHCTGGRGQLLLPWPNRIAGGRYEFGGSEHHLPLTESAQDNAIHGLARWANWQPAERTSSSLAMELRLHAQPGWPWVLDLRVEYELTAAGLSVRTTARNISSERCPYGAGAHPYIRLEQGTIDGASLRAPGTQFMTTDAKQIPTGSESAAGTPYDFLTPRIIGEQKLDTGYSELQRDADGLARVTLGADGRQVTLWLDSGFPFLMLFTGDALGQPEKRRAGLGVEPMTCAPNAFNSGEGLLVLEPGEDHTATWGIRAG